VDAYPDETFQGEVFQVSSVPMTGSWPNTDLREYATEIRLTDSVERIRKLRPGLTTQVEIQIDSRENVLQVPVQAVIGVSDKQICYVLKKDGTPQRREIKVGATNQTHIEVLDGLEAGEQVILNPRNRFSDEISKLESEWNSQRTRENPAAATPDGLAQPAPGATAPAPGGSAPAGGRGPGGGPEAASAPGGGPPNPEAIFARLDKDSDGKISKAEAPEQMLDRFADLDKDGDGSLSLDEFKAGMGSGRPGGGRPPGGPGAPG
jgi:HlyD family secretion protein